VVLRQDAVEAGAKEISRPEKPERPPVEPRQNHWTPWADLLKRVFLVDALACPRCGGRMRILAAVLAPEAVQAILAHSRLPTGPPPRAAASWPLALGEPGHPCPDFFADPPALEDADGQL
jgi:hypothetical protein